MAMLVTGVGTLIHIYSIGYMAHEARYQRFFFYLNFFILAMLVLGDEQQLPVHVRGLGRRGSRLVPADRLLVRAARRAVRLVCRRRQEGVLGQPRRRRRLPDRHVHHLDAGRLADLPDSRGAGGQHAAVGAGGHYAAADLCGERQERTVPALRLAAGRHGGPDACFGAHPCRHNGHRRRLLAGAYLYASGTSRWRLPLCWATSAS